MNLDSINFDAITTSDDMFAAYKTVFEGFPLDSQPTDAQITEVETALGDPRWGTVADRLTTANVLPTQEQSDTLDQWFTVLSLDHMFSGLSIEDDNSDASDI